MNLSKNQVVRFKNTHLDVECISGVLWITWPDSHERILKAGQSVTIVSRGAICIQAFAPAALNVGTEKKRLPGLGLRQRRYRFREAPV